MKLKWLKDKLGEKFYPIAHATGVVIGDNKTLDSKLAEIDKSLTEINKDIEKNGYGEISGGNNLAKSFVSGTHSEAYYPALHVNAELQSSTRYTLSFVGAAGHLIYLNENVFDVGSGIFITCTGERQYVTATTLNSLPSAERNSNGWQIFKNNTGNTIKPSFTDVQIESGSMATPYEPYFSSNRMLTEETNDLDKRISDNGYGEVAGGKNLANFSKLGTKTTNGITFEYQSNGSIKVSGTVSTDGNVYTPLELIKTRLSKGCWYTTSVKSSNPNSIAKVFFTGKGDATTLQMSETADLYYYIQFVPTGSTNNNLTAGTVIDEILYPQIEEGETATGYEPYFPSNKMLAEENTKQSIEMMDIKMLGWSVPRECPIQNEVNDKQFIQKVGRVDLGSLAYTYESNNIQFYSEVISSLPQEESWNYNLYCNKYPTGSISGDSFIASYGGRIYIRDKNYTDASVFKTAMQGQYLYYGLATPITTTIDGNEIGETVGDVRKETTVNLFKPTLETTTKNGVTCTNNGDGTYTLNGTASVTTHFVFGALNLEKNVCLRLIGMTNSSDTRELYVQTVDGTSQTAFITDNDGIFTCSFSTKYNVGCVISKNEKLANILIKPMITTNLSATYSDFVPYTGDSGSLNGDVADLRGDMYFEKEISLAKAQLIKNGSYSDINIISSLFFFGANGKFGLSRGYISLSLPFSFSKKDEIYIKLPYKQYGYKKDDLLPYIYKTVFCTQGDFNGKIIGTCNLSYYSGSDDEGISLTIDINDNYSFTDNNISSAYVNLRF